MKNSRLQLSLMTLLLRAAVCDVCLNSLEVATGSYILSKINKQSELDIRLHFTVNCKHLYCSCECQMLPPASPGWNLHVDLFDQFTKVDNKDIICEHHINKLNFFFTLIRSPYLWTGSSYHYVLKELQKCREHLLIRGAMATIWLWSNVSLLCNCWIERDTCHWKGCSFRHWMNSNNPSFSPATPTHSALVAHSAL